MPNLTLAAVSSLMVGSLAAATVAQQTLLRRPTATLVWQSPKADSGGSVSPDGRYLTFTDWDTGNLMVRDLTTDTDRIIVPANNVKGGRVSVSAEASTISRDGRQVAYSWFDEGKDRYELWVANLLGDASPRRLYASDNGEWLAPRDWSPDGKSIVALLSSKDFTLKLGLISVASGEVRILKSGHFPGNTRPFFSPDGNYLAYDLPQDAISAGDVWVMVVDGSSDHRVIGHRARDVVMGWSPDGQHLLFASDRTGSMALFALGMQSGIARGLPIALKPDIGFADSLGVTTSGALFWSTRPGTRGGSIQLAQFDLHSGAVRSARDVSPSPHENNVNPSWSPDGKYLAYVSVRGRAGEPPTIVLRTADAGGLVGLRE